VAAHGNTLTVEDTNISTWARLWGKRIALFGPGMLVAALARECQATGGALSRAGTRSTAMSQHCLCGARVPKTLAQRTHDCPHCGLRGDRDIVSAALSGLRDPCQPRGSAHRAGQLPACPRPTGGAGLPARVGGFSQPAPATSTPRWCGIGQDRQSPPGGLC
jgi:transposase